MNNSVKEKKSFISLGRFTTIMCVLLDGLLTLTTAFLRNKLDSPFVIAFFILFAISLWYLFSHNPDNYTGSELRRFSFMAVIINFVISNAIVFAFMDSILVTTTIMAQWLCNMLFLSVQMCYGMVVIHSAILLIYTFVPYFGFFTIPEMCTIFTAVFVGAWCTIKMINLMNNQMDITRQQHESLGDMLKLVDVKFEEAKASNKAKSGFLANMSHEIRTPINSVLGFNTMILRENNDEQIQQYALDIQGAGRSLLNIINDILDFSKIEAGKLEIIPVEYDVSSLIFDELNMIDARARAKGLEVRAEVDPILPTWLLGDDVRIRQVITNLLTNAVKYTSEGSITLKIEAETERDIVHLHIHVIDTGNGIKEEDLAKLYEKFVRIEESRNRNIEGTGLGINIVTSLLSAMDSKLEVESEYGVGSDFHFRIDQKIIFDEPIGDLEEKLSSRRQGEEYENTYICPDARLLVVDDNPMNRTVFINLLKELGCKIDEAGGGKECLSLLDKYKYDIIFMDHMMPEMDGIETLHAINKLGPEENLSHGCPVIILTANAISGAKEMYLNEGFDDFLSKPVIPEDLEEMIKTKLPPELVKEGEKKKKKSQGSDFDADVFPKIQGVDWNYGYLHLPSEELIEGTVKNFYAMIETEASELEEMYKHIEESDEAVDAFRIKVHAMKASAILWGALPIAGTAAMLEFASRDKNIPLVKDVTPHFLSEWRGYKEKLREMCVDEEAEANKEAYDKAEVEALLDELVEKLNCFDVHGADDCLSKINSYSYPDDINNILDKIAGIVMNLDVDKIDGLVNELKEKL